MAEGAESLVPDRVAGVEGLDVALGLRSVQGVWPAYERLLRMFLRQHADDVGAVRRSLAAGQWQEAHRIAHTLKGSARTLGAARVGAAAEQLDQVVRTGTGDAGEVEALLQVLDGLCVRFMEQLAAALPPPPAAEGAASVDWGEARLRLRQLRELLVHDDARSLEHFEAHARVLHAALGVPAAMIEQQVQSFDFENALRSVDAALATVAAQAIG